MRYIAYLSTLDLHIDYTIHLKMCKIRRNLTNEQRLRLIGQMQETRKQAHGNHAERDEETGQYLKGQNEPLGEKPKTTAEAIAPKIAGEE